MITAGAAYLLVVLLLVIYSKIISSFLILFSTGVLLSAYGLIPPFLWPVLQLLGLMSLWIELAQIEGRGASSLPDKRESQLRRLSWAGGGIACGGLLALVADYSFVFTLGGAFLAVVILSIVEGGSLGMALRRSLVVVDEEPSGSVMKAGFWLLLLITLLISSIQ